MKTKDFIRLPLGKYELFDKFYNYSLEKGLTDDGKIIYCIKDKSIWNRSFCLFENDEPVFDDRKTPTYKTLSFALSVAGIHFSGDVSYWSLRDLKIKPKSSYLEFIKKVESPVHELA